jgi:23S rRNA (cytosine1962-C5)-methyltransferase
MNKLILKPKADKVLDRRHPWVFSGAIKRIEGQPEKGDTVEVFSSDGRWQARGAYSPQSQIRTRIWTWDEGEIIDEAFFGRRLEKAILRRHELDRDPATNAYREVFAESDGLPGLIIDRYASYRVIQLLSAGVERWRSDILEQITNLVNPTGVLERSDVDVRRLEGLPERVEILAGEVPDQPVEIIEHDQKYKVDLMHGHKTGFYLDQRDNRNLAKKLLAGSRVLNCFAYTGGFTLSALHAGAEEVVSIETSEDAIALAHDNVLANDFDPKRCQWITEDVFVELRKRRDRVEQFDAIVLDPPRFASSSKQIKGAARGYKDINLLAFKLLRPGGILLTFSCSGNIDEALFQKIVADAALDAKVEASIEGRMTQGPDHPVLLSFPEGRYLKGLICRRW